MPLGWVPNNKDQAWHDKAYQSEHEAEDILLLTLIQKDNNDNVWD